MKFSVVFQYLANLLPIIAAVPENTTPLSRPKLHEHLTAKNEQLSKTAQIIKFVNSVYSDAGRGFIRRGGYNDFFSNKGHNKPLITTVGLNDANTLIGKMIDLLRGNDVYGRNQIQKADKSIRYYLIDNPEVLDRYRKKRMNELRQSEESFVSFDDYTSSSSLERERKHAIRRYVENFGFGEREYAPILIEKPQYRAEAEMESNYDINTDDLLKNIMPKVLDTTEASFHPSFPDDIDDKPFSEDTEPEKNEEKRGENNEENPIKLVKSAESEKISTVMKNEEQRNIKGNDQTKDFRIDGYNKVLGLEQDEAQNKDDEGYKKPSSLEEKTTKSGKNDDEQIKKEAYQPILPEEKSAEIFKEGLNWREESEWKQDYERQKSKYKREDWYKKKKNFDDDDNVDKKDDMKHLNKADKAYGWQKNSTREKDKNIQNSKPTVTENEWDLRDKTRNKNINHHELNSHNREDVITLNKDSWNKKSDEYDKQRPDWDKQNFNDNDDKKKDISEKHRYKKKEAWSKNNDQQDSRQDERNNDLNKKDQRDQKDWNTRDNQQGIEYDWDKRHNIDKKSNEWDKTDDRDKKLNAWDRKDEEKKKSNNWDERDDRNKKLDNWDKGDSRNTKNSDGNRKENDWDKKNESVKNDDDWNKGNVRYQRKDYDRKDYWNKNNDWDKNNNQRDRKDDDWNKKTDDWNKKNDENNWKKSDDKRKTDDWDKNNNDWNKKDNEWDKKDKQFGKKDLLRNKKDDWTSKDVDRDKKEDNRGKKNKKSHKKDDEYIKPTTDGSNWDKVGVEGNKNEEMEKYDTKSKYNSGEEKKTKKIIDDYNSYEKKPKKTNDWDNYVPKIADYYKPKKIKRHNSYERPHNPPPAFGGYGRTPIPFVGKKRIYADK